MKDKCTHITSNETTNSAISISIRMTNEYDYV